MLVFRKSTERVLDEIIASLEPDHPLREAAETPGTVTRSILAAVASALSQAYDQLQGAYEELWVTKSSVMLDEHGQSVQVLRLPGEDDEHYRTRILQAPVRKALANEQAIVQLALETEGVREVRFAPYTHGTGSFTLHVLAQDVSQADAVVEQVRQAISPQLPGGIFAHVVHAKLLPVQARLRLIPHPGVATTQAQADALRDRARLSVIAYINNLRMGEELSSLRLASAALVEGVADVAVEALVVDGQVSLADNYRPFPDEKLYVQTQSDIEVL